MWMLSSTTCVGLRVAQAPIQPVEAISTLGTKIFQQCLTLAGISMMADVTPQMEKSRIMETYIR